MALNDWVFHSSWSTPLQEKLRRGAQTPAQRGFQEGRETSRDAGETATAGSVVFIVFMYSQVDSPLWC